ncbi:LutC/YkgG family protein [Thermoflexus sp.]|uniref:LutC/YkgG family protein n=1 Tax=Thermoflexus sp. TaxID=1969742 RepID=UPI0025EDD833|nr:lactate utilization protein [Thermoflexus sp.]MDW8181761.1 lactate utilization protein [Anaerolineae bacterium]MCS6964083.1 lactate utilization protein [Thermoflexus sp.]MCS7352298.1 lactate utilization protein [Thermoflexus sp.]MCX7689385.1 lactate utilization protein [Thermoflexus sp.]MDW8183941.1 lactate utilization protein [Anaerolineae bacterium]
MSHPVLEAVRRRVTHRQVPLGPAPALPFDAPPGSEAVIQRLWASWAEVGVHAFRCATEAEAIRGVVAWLRERQIRQVLTDARTARSYPGLIPALEDAGLAVMSGTLPREEGPRYLGLGRWATAEAGITEAVAAFADTGTIWVMGGLGGARCASLLPPVHLALIRRAQVYPCMAAWLREARASGALMEWVEESSAMIAITGPSRTSDIEKVLTLGVHGPKEVIAFLIEEAG